MKWQPEILFWLAFAGVACLTGGRVLLAGSAPERAPESELKAAYLLNFLRFVEFPTAGGRQICLLGQDPIAPVLEDVAKTQHVGGNAVRFRQIRMAAEAEGCHLVFIARQVAGIRAAVAQMRTAPVLTVGEHPGFLDEGGMILLFWDAGRLQFELNLDRIRQAGLSPSAKLIVLSRSAR